MFCEVRKTGERTLAAMHSAMKISSRLNRVTSDPLTAQRLPVAAASAGAVSATALSALVEFIVLPRFR